jgi:hypothetical protein
MGVPTMYVRLIQAYDQMREDDDDDDDDEDEVVVGLCTLNSADPPPPRLIGCNMCRPMRRLNDVCVGQ